VKEKRVQKHRAYLKDDDFSATKLLANNFAATSATKRQKLVRRTPKTSQNFAHTDERISPQKSALASKKCAQSVSRQRHAPLKMCAN